MQLAASESQGGLFCPPAVVFSQTQSFLFRNHFVAFSEAAWSYRIFGAHFGFKFLHPTIQLLIFNYFILKGANKMGGEKNIIKIGRSDN